MFYAHPSLNHVRSKWIFTGVCSARQACRSQPCVCCFVLSWTGVHFEGPELWPEVSSGGPTLRLWWAGFLLAVHLWAGRKGWEGKGWNAVVRFHLCRLKARKWMDFHPYMQPGCHLGLKRHICHMVLYGGSQQLIDWHGGCWQESCYLVHPFHMNWELGSGPYLYLLCCSCFKGCHPTPSIRLPAQPPKRQAAHFAAGEIMCSCCSLSFTLVLFLWFIVTIIEKHWWYCARVTWLFVPRHSVLLDIVDSCLSCVGNQDLLYCFKLRFVSLVCTYLVLACTPFTWFALSHSVSSKNAGGCGPSCTDTSV